MDCTYAWLQRMAPCTVVNLIQGESLQIQAGVYVLPQSFAISHAEKT